MVTETRCRRSTPPILAKCVTRMPGGPGRDRPRPVSCCLPVARHPAAGNVQYMIRQSLPWPGGVFTKWRCPDAGGRQASLWEQAYGDVGEVSTSGILLARDMLTSACLPAHGPRARRAQRPVLPPACWRCCRHRAVELPAIAMGMVSARNRHREPAGSSLRPCPRPSATILWKFKEVEFRRLQLLPRPESSVMGDYSGTPDISLICFTRFDGCGPAHRGKAAKVRRASGRSSGSSRKPGGKNATIVDDDADLDEAVAGRIWPSVFRGRSARLLACVIVLGRHLRHFCPASGIGGAIPRTAPPRPRRTSFWPAGRRFPVKERARIHRDQAEAEGKVACQALRSAVSSGVACRC